MKMMTNSEAIKLLSQEKIPMILDGKSNESLVIAHIEAISALEENDKLKAEIEQLNGIISRDMDKHECYVISKSIEVNNLKIEIEQLKAELEQSVRLPLTNADKIRSMSNEELAELLNDSIPIFNCDICDIRHEQGSCNASSDECNSAILRWLQSEVDNGN
jgi:hypothetical protein